MRITEVRSAAVRVPLERPISIATRAITGREYLLVWVDTDEGPTGVGFTCTGTTGGLAAQEALRGIVAPVVVGQDPGLIERLWAAVYQDSLLTGRRGLVLRVLSAVDIALWDLLGKVAGLPLNRLLGGSADRVPAYASGGYYGDGDPVEAVHREIEHYAKLGFSDYKMKVGGASHDIDVARVAAAREALGDGGRLALDANNAWRYPADAIRFGRAVAPQDIWWLEEPLGPDDVDGHAVVTAALPYPVATGELLGTRWEFARVIEAKAAAILQPDAGVLGGISEWMKVAHAAACSGLPVAPHWHANLHAHLAAAVGNCLTVEYFALDRDIFNFERLLPESARLAPADGQLPVPTAPGHGVAFDDAAVDAWRLTAR
jgi:L-alanine-DL-glutamate epimerase-like enolase superfamily enzyme